MVLEVLVRCGGEKVKWAGVSEHVSGSRYLGLGALTEALELGSYNPEINV